MPKISHDELKEGIKTGIFRTKLREKFPKEMGKLEEWESVDGLCCGRVMHALGMLLFQVNSMKLTRQDLL